jgi:hypothetical protein
MIELRPLFELSALVDTPQVTPDGPYGTRRFIPVMGGTFKGERLSGVLLAGGSDCQLIRPDGVAELDVRVTLKTEDGVTIFMRGLGIRSGSQEVMARIAKGEIVPSNEYYFRESMTFEAPQSGGYEWLNRIIAIGHGERRPDSVHLSVYEVI